MSTTSTLTDSLIARGPVFSGGTPERAAELAEEWADACLGCDPEEWMDADVWCPDTAEALHIAGVTPDQVKQCAAALLAHFGPDTYTSGCPVYALCNNDLSVDDFTVRTAYRVYHAPEGSLQSFCGEFDDLSDAQGFAMNSPRGLSEDLWGTARTAGHCGGLSAPDRDGRESDDEGEPREAISWHGRDGCYCVIETTYNLRD